jgi:membrane protein
MKGSGEENTVRESPGKAHSLRQWAFSHRPAENPAKGMVRSWLRILFIVVHEFGETAISLRASALTYTIVLSLVPVLAMSTAVLKGLGSDNQLRLIAYKFIDQLEPAPRPEAADPGPPAGGLEPAAPGVERPITDEPASITAHLRNAVDTIFEYVDRTNFAALGAFGIAGLLLTVVLVLSTIEEAMNAIWHTRERRSMFRKTMDYLALLILLPVSINVALAGDAIMRSPDILARIYTVVPADWAVRMLLNLLPFLFVILTLMFMYVFIPNIKVRTHAALAGALFAGFFWFLVQKIYIILQVGVAKYNAIYGSFATVPLFLIWVHIGWTFILLGASLAYAVQNRSLYHLPGSGVSPQRKLQLAFDILDTMYLHFREKKKTSLDELVSEHRGELPGDILDVTDRLLKGGLIRRVDENSSFVPAAPAENIEAREVVRLFLGHEEIPTPGGEFSSKVINAAEKAIPAEAFPRQAAPESRAGTTAPPAQDTHHGQDEKTL